MKEKHKQIIIDIVRIKVNLFFLIIFGIAMVYAAEMLGEAIKIKEFFFWIAMLLILMFQTFKPMTIFLDTIQEIITRDKDAKCTKDDGGKN